MQRLPSKRAIWIAATPQKIAPQRTMDFVFSLEAANHQTVLFQRKSRNFGKQKMPFDENLSGESGCGSASTTLGP